MLNCQSGLKLGEEAQNKAVLSFALDGRLVQCQSKPKLVPGMNVYRRAITYKGGPGLASQVIGQVSTLVEAGVFASFSDKGEKHDIKIEVTHESLDDCVVMPNMLNHRLLHYVLAGVKVSEGYTSLSLASDKASVNGMTLDAGAFVWPGNESSVAVFQVELTQMPGSSMCVQRPANISGGVWCI